MKMSRFAKWLQDNYMTRAQAAEHLECAPSTIAKHIRDGKIKEERAPGFAGLPRAQVEALRGVVGTRRTLAQIQGLAPQMTSRERQLRAWQMRTRAARSTLEQIRKALGYASISGVQRAIRAEACRQTGERGGGHAISGRLRRGKTARRGARNGA